MLGARVRRAVARLSERGCLPYTEAQRVVPRVNQQSRCASPCSTMHPKALPVVPTMKSRALFTKMAKAVPMPVFLECPGIALFIGSPLLFRQILKASLTESSWVVIEKIGSSTSLSARLAQKAWCPMASILPARKEQVMLAGTLQWIAITARK